MFGIFKKKSDKLRNSKSTVSNTGYKGITKRADNGKYQAQVNISIRNRGKAKAKSKMIWSTRTNTLEEAIKAREEFINSLY